ncbi:MAG: DNA repair protein [Chloroflexi bacterium]|nr:DNA repair protein [Chloroflexota bacterium]
MSVHAPITDHGSGLRLLSCVAALDEHFGHEPHWWPVITDRPQFEVIVGAVLVQQTRWETVEAAVARLRDAGLMAPAAMAACETSALAALIRPCAFHMQKAPGLQAICRALLVHYAGDAAQLLAGERAVVRGRLLMLPRIGRETADTIMLYGGGWPLFVVDAYARRLFARLDLVPGFDFLRASYDAVQALIEGELAAYLPWHTRGDGRSFSIHRMANTHGDATFFYAQLHALIVEACVHHCLARKPRCDRPGQARMFVDPLKCAAHCVNCSGCPLRHDCAAYRRGMAGLREAASA